MQSGDINMRIHQSTDGSFPRSIASRIVMTSAILVLAICNVADVKADILWASTGNFNANGGGRVYTIDLTTQTVTLVGDTGLDRLDALAFDNNGVLYGVANGSGGPATVYTINTTTAVPTLVGDITDPDRFGVGSIAFDFSGTLFAGSGLRNNPNEFFEGRLLTLEPTTAAVLTDIAMTGSGNRHLPGLAFDPNGQLFGSRGNSSGHTEDIVRINTTTGVQTAVGGTTRIISDIWFAPGGTLYAASPRDPDPSVTALGDLFTIDPVTGTKSFLFNSGIRISGMTGLGLLPDATDDMAATLANLAVDIPVLANDDEGDEPLTVAIPAKGAPDGPTNGTTSQTGCNLKSSCVVTYTPDAGFGGVDTFRYTLTDRDGDQSDALVTVEVEATVAVAEPDPALPDAPVTVFMSADNPDSDNPFDFIYEKITPGGGGTVTADCCRFQDYRETAGSGKGHNLFFKPRKLDIGKALRNAVKGPDPFDPSCAALIPFVPKGKAIAKPWQRIAPDPNPGNPPRYNDIDYVESLFGAFCIINSDVQSDGVALTVENATNIAGYANNCDEDDVDFRPVTGTISLDPKDKDAPFVQTTSAECDASRSAKRSSISGYWINMRNDPLGHSSHFPIVLSMLKNLSREISAERFRPSCSPRIPTAELKALQHQLWKATFSVIRWHRKPQEVISKAVPELEKLTLMSLDLPSCSSNFRAVPTGRSMAATFASCSYLGHPKDFDADKIGADDDCLINPVILDKILDPN